MGIVEAILFVTGNAVEKSEICRAMGITHEELEETLNALEGGYDYDRRGLRLLRFGQHVQLATRPDTPNMWKSCFNRCRSSRFHRR